MDNILENMYRGWITYWKICTGMDNILENMYRGWTTYWKICTGDGQNIGK
jgi:hypothetical protein